MTAAQRKLLENFDDEVREKLRMRDEATKEYQAHFDRQLMRLARHELGAAASFIDEASFRLDTLPAWVSDRSTPTGLYELPRRSGEAHYFRLNHPLGEATVTRALERPLPVAEVVFDYSAHEGKISALHPFVGQSGWMRAELLSVDALDQSEDHLLLTGLCDDGTVLDAKLLGRMLSIDATVGAPLSVPLDLDAVLAAQLAESCGAIRHEISGRNARFFETEAAKLDGWADDLKVGLERDLKELDRQIKEARRTATVGVTLEEKLAGQKALKTLEAERSTKRRTLFDAQDNIDAQRADLIAQIEAKLEQHVKSKPLFTIRWSAI
jgi:adenine-specific DNA-methyltransferase